jgi:SAM-dependent methyltransferase
MFRTTARIVFDLLPSRIQQSVNVGYKAIQARIVRKALATVGASDVAVPDINHLLHHLRGEALRMLPKGAAHFVSVGCSGTWYFKWIEEMYGRMELHTGIEFYSPCPPDLPANITWIANTAGSMPEINDAVADILFSGQNIEHLWPDDIASFLLEAHRIIKKGGLLVVDSPNRRITAKLGWSHPEHIIELETEEIVELLKLAGFDVERQHGIWLCEDPDTDTVLPFEHISSNGPWPIVRRVSLAAEQPSSSFIWWVEARKREHIPQVSKLRERVSEIFALAWTERLNRLKTMIGTEFTRNGKIWLDSNSHGGALVFGPYAPLLPGHYSVTFKLLFLDPSSAPESCGAVCEVTSGDGLLCHARREILTGDALTGSEFDAILDFSLNDTSFGIQFRVIAMKGIRLGAEKAIKLIAR